MAKKLTDGKIESSDRFDNYGYWKKTNRRQRVAKYVFAIFVFGFFITARQFHIGSTVTVANNVEKVLYDKFFDPTKRSLHSNVSAAPDIPTRNESARLPKTLVIYFPQYHRDSVNDRNWGDNFTDWDSLRSVGERNRFDHPIPRPLDKTISKNSSDLPPPLGWYDLTETKPRETQGILAKKYDIDGFIYHHYWFYDEANPGPTLAKPLERMLEDGHPDLPFLLNWCAVRWVNVWMGRAIFQKIPTSKNRAITLQEQYFNVTQDAIYQHYLWLKPFFQHPNYIRVDDQPVFMVYNYDARALPVLESLRRYAIEDGFPGLHFIVGRSSHHEDIYDISHLDQDDKKIDYWLNKMRQPRDLVDPTRTKTSARSIYASDFLSPILDKNLRVKELTWDYNPLNQTMTYPYPLEYINKVFTIPDWCIRPATTMDATNSSSSRLASNRAQVDHPELIGVVTTFDNTPRRKVKSAKVFMHHETPDEAVERFAESYRAALYYQKCCVSGASGVAPRLNSASSNHKSNDDRFVVINAWNEWAEAMSIEPSDVYGYRWLETIQAVQRRVDEERCVWE